MDLTGQALLAHYEAQRTAGKKAPEIAAELGVGKKTLEARLTAARKERDLLQAARRAGSTGNAVVALSFECRDGWKQRFLNLSDVHWDSPYCNRDLLDEHLREAVETDALIFVFGDLNDAMQGRFDPRRSMNELREEYRREDYYDILVSRLCDYWRPYARNTKLLARGNHETAVLKNANTDLIGRQVDGLNQACGTEILTGGYGGWVHLRLNSGDRRWIVKVKYYHGSGGESPVTRGVIQTNRQAVYLPDADVVINGHNHHNYYVPISRERVSNRGELYFDIQHHVRVPGYKMDYADGTGGWMVERGGVPKPIGCVWMVIEMRNGAPEIRFEIDIRGSMPIAPINPGGGAEYAGQFAEDTEYP